ncbi:sperm-associated antigen 5 isoform X1 [Falco rusticolus]|uniref:sperm-associated antigen 5 isoform X1 n=1 Tax=Falco rusticolus TaxID=120794 RepID=UPI001886A46D|nr:sperm-associated antigen 5 isoform X1 [Falco rusticolus]
MWAARAPAAARRPRRLPLQELQLQPGAEHTTLTPLFRRLRLENCGTPVSCTRGRPRKPTLAPRPLEPLKSISPEPPSSPVRGPCTPKPASSPVPAPICSAVLGPCTPEPPSSPVRGPCTPEPPSSPVRGPCTPEPPSSPVRGPCTPEPPSSPVPAPICSSVLGLTTPDPPSSPGQAPCTPETPSSPIPGPCTSEALSSSVLESRTPESPSIPEPPDSTMPAPLCSPIPVLHTSEPCGSVTPMLCTPGPPSISSSVPCTTNPPGSTIQAPCTLQSPGSTSLASCTPGPPGTSSTPREAPFHRWQVVPTHFSCSPAGTMPLAGGAGPLSCQDTPEGAESPAPPEQDPPELPPTEAQRLEPAGLEATATPVPLPEVAPGAVSWMLPLVWLEKSLGTLSPLDSLRHSLPLPVAATSAGTSVTPVAATSAGTSVTPVAATSAGTSVTPVAATSAGTSVTPVAATSAGTSVTPVAATSAGTSVTPVAAMSAGTFMTPRDLQERSMNTYVGAPPCAKDSAAETDSLLWHCPREQLKSLPRAELEVRLESTLIIIEALSLQLRHCQESQRLLPGVGPAEQRDVFMQTDITHAKGEEEIYRNLYLELRRKTEALQWQRGAEQDLRRQLELALERMGDWSRQRLLFQGFVDATSQSLQDEQAALTQEREQVRALVSRCGAVLERVPSKLRSCLEERDAMRQRAEEALRAKEEGDRFLEAFRAHASAQISARSQSLASQQELGTLLANAIHQQASLSAETQSFREFIDVTFENLEEERRALDVEREQVRALVSWCRAVLERVPNKLRSCLEERDAVRQQADEALQAKEEASCQLKKTSVALQDAVAQLEQLTVDKSCLSAELSSLMTNLASVEQERDELQQQNRKQCEEITQLAQERDALQQDCNGLRQELREATECREFLDQENCMSRTQLLEVEAKLKSTLAALQERTLQYEELMNSHECLCEEQAALCKELESTKAKLLDLQHKRDKVSWCFTDIAKSKMRLQELADSLRAALQEEDDDAPSRSRAWSVALQAQSWQTPRCAWTPARCTPARARTSFVGSALKALSAKDADETTGGGGAFTKDKPSLTAKPPEPETSLLESMKELRAVVSDVATLSFRVQEQEQSKFKALQTEISDLQLRLATVTSESKEKMDTQAATIAKLNKALRGKIESEKELQDVVKQQEEKMLQLLDQRGEVMQLKEERSQLSRALQRAETEVKVLWEEVRGQEPKVDTAHVQERVLLQQQLDKLRLLLLEKENENMLRSDKYLGQIRGLELRLQHVQKILRTHEEMQEKMKEVLSAVPDMAANCQELHCLLLYLGLEPGTSSKEAAEPL